MSISSTGRVPSGRMPRTAVTASVHPAASRTAARSMNDTPSRSAGPAVLIFRATSIASRVLPMPPGPISVTRCTSGSRSKAATAAISSSRPMIGVSGAGSGAGAGRRRCRDRPREPLGQQHSQIISEQFADPRRSRNAYRTPGRRPRPR